jgi:hypothetical protein
MAHNLTREEIDSLWEQGYRPYEIYTCNPEIVEYYGEIMQPGEIKGWDITFVFAKRESLKTYPFFDCIIMGDCVASCTEIWHG